MNKNKSVLTTKLLQNWWIDAFLGISSVLAILSSLYFLAFPIGGYQGGRNPNYQIIVFFNRNTWDFIHTWSGVGMIIVALWHIIIHWKWIMGTTKRIWQLIAGKSKGFGMRLTYNIILDAVIGVSFLICAISGVIFLFFPGYNHTEQIMMFDTVTWDLIHTWSGVLMTMAAILHFVFHWKWVVNITKKMLTRKPTLRSQTVLTTNLDQL
jgi:hypothetical protein